jgi:hypothetical protein
VWARFDDRFHENRKIKRAWRRCPSSIGLHVMAITYSAGHLTDGFVDVDFVEDRMPAKRARQRAVEVLVDVGLWSPCDEGWSIHDFAEFNETKADIEERRDKKSRAGKIGAAKRWGDDSDIAPAIATATSTQDGAMAKNGTEPVTEPVAVTDPREGADAPVDSRVDQAKGRLQVGAVQQVFDAWIESTGKTGRTMLTRKRRDLIARWLKTYAVDELIDAVRGWKHDPHNRGETNGTAYNDIELLLRDAAHIEKFRDLERGAAEKSGDSFLANLNARHGVR